MNTKHIILAGAAALSLIATPALAQSKSGKTPTTQRSNPGVQVLSSPKAFKAHEAKLGTSSKAALQALRSAKSGKTTSFESKLDAVGLRLGDIDGESKKLSGALSPRAKTGKTKTARALISKVASHNRTATTHLATAKKAYGKGNLKAAQRSLAAVEVEVRAIDELASKLALLEPVVHR